MKYFQIEHHWNELRSIYESDQATEIWYDKMQDFGKQKDEDYGIKNCRTEILRPELTPRDYDSVNWRYHLEDGKKEPEFWKYVCHGACHWLINLNLFVAQQYDRTKGWRIVSGKKHSTVWDGKDTLFDANFLALRVSADKAYELADDVHYQQNQFVP